MNGMEWLIVSVSLAGLLLWIRGCVRDSLNTCTLALILPAVAVGGYFLAFRLTRTPYLAAGMLLPYLVVLLFAGRILATTGGKVLAGVLVVLMAGCAGAELKLISMGNALLTIEPYRSGSIWRFDEPLLHLKGEPFVQGIPEMIDKMVQGIPGSEKQVRLIFSQNRFPGWQHRLDLTREQDGGNWYFSKEYKMEGWLCPALFKFFARAPRHIYVRAEAI